MPSHLTQVCIFCEGSRFTEAKHEKGLQFAREKGLKELKYHLIPRTKGFSILAKHLKTTGEGSALVCVARKYLWELLVQQCVTGKVHVKPTETANTLDVSSSFGGSYAPEPWPQARWLVFGSWSMAGYETHPGYETPGMIPWLWDTGYETLSRRPWVGLWVWYPGYETLGIRPWVWDPGYQTLGIRPWLWDPGYQTLGIRPWLWDPGYQTLGIRPWVSDPGYQTLGIRPWVSDPGYQTLGIRPWVSDPGYQTLGIRPCVSDPGYQTLGMRLHVHMLCPRICTQGRSSKLPIQWRCWPLVEKTIYRSCSTITQGCDTDLSMSRVLCNLILGLSPCSEVSCPVWCCVCLPDQLSAPPIFHRSPTGKTHRSSRIHEVRHLVLTCGMSLACGMRALCITVWCGVLLRASLFQILTWFKLRIDLYLGDPVLEMCLLTGMHSLVHSPTPSFCRLQYGKVGRARYFSSRDNVIDKF